MLQRRLDRRWLGAAAALFVLDIALHLPIEDFFDEIARRYGFFWYDGLAQNIFIVVGIALVAALWWSRRDRRTVVRYGVAAVAAAVLLAKAFLLVAAIENIHYLQYALLVIALAQSRLRLETSWLIAAGLGVVDEYYQFVMLPRGTPNYLDADDIVLNAVGGLLGVVMLLAWSRRQEERPLITSSTMARLLFVALIVASIFWPILRSPFYNTTPGGRHFHLLTWFEAIVVLGVIWTGVRQLAQSRPSPSDREA